MGALANAAVLIKDTTFLDQCMAGAAYQARQVVLEDPATPDHQVRLDLALTVITSPESFRTRFAIYLATDPTVSGKGNTAALVTEATIIEKTAAIWTTVAKIGGTF